MAAPEGRVAGEARARAAEGVRLATVRVTPNKVETPGHQRRRRPSDPDGPACCSRSPTGAPESRRCGAPGGIRTPDPRLRRPMLYPAELQAPRLVTIHQHDTELSSRSFLERARWSDASLHLSARPAGELDELPREGSTTSSW